MKKWLLILSLFITTLILISCDTTSSTDNNDNIVGSKPVLELVGNDTILLDSGEIYVELGCNAYDQEDGFLTDSVKVGYYKYDKTATLNSNSIGDSCCICFVKYTVVDKDGNSVATWRTIIIGSVEIIDTNVVDTTNKDTSNTKDSAVYLHVSNIMPIKSGDTSTITLTVFKDSTLTVPLPEIKVFVTSNQGVWISTMSLTTNSMGTAYFQCSYNLPAGTKEENIPLAFIYNEQRLNTSITVYKDSLVDKKKSIVISANPITLIADGKSSSQISVKLKDENFNPVSNEVILFNTTKGNITSVCTTNELGVAVASLVSSIEQCNATISAILKSDSTVKISINVFFNDTSLGILGGMVLNQDGSLSENVEAILIPIDYNPQKDSSISLFTSITDMNGCFQFQAVYPGNYNVLIKDDPSKSICLSKNIEVKPNYNVYTNTTLTSYGTLILNFPDIFTADDFIYIIGTPFKWKVSELPKAGSNGYVIAELPSGKLPSISTTSSFLPAITDTIIIYENDTTIVNID